MMVVLLFFQATLEATDSRSFDEIAETLEESIDLFAPHTLMRQASRPQAWELNLGRLLEKDNLFELGEESKVFHADRLGLGFAISLERLSRQDFSPVVIRNIKLPLKEMLAELKHWFLQDGFSEHASSKKALLGFETVLRYAGGRGVLPCEVYALMWQLAKFEPMLNLHRVSGKRAKRLVLESLESLPSEIANHQDAEKLCIFRAIRSLKTLASPPSIAPVDPEGFPLGPTLDMRFLYGPDLTSPTLMNHTMDHIHQWMHQVSLPEPSQRRSESTLRQSSRDQALACLSSWTPERIPRKDLENYRKSLAFLLKLLNHLESEASLEWGTEHLLGVIPEMLDTARMLYLNGSLDEMELALSALLGLLQLLKKPLSEEVYLSNLMECPLSFLEIVSLCWQKADSIEKKRVVLECVSTFAREKRHYVFSFEDEMFSNQLYGKEAIKFRVCMAFASLFPIFYAKLTELSQDQLAFQELKGEFRRRVFYRFFVDPDVVRKQLIPRSIERYIRIKEAETRSWSPSASLSLKISRIFSELERNENFKAGLEVLGVQEVLSSLILGKLEEVYTLEEEGSIEKAFAALKGLNQIFKCSLTDQAFSSHRLVLDPMPLLDFYRIGFGSVNHFIMMISDKKHVLLEALVESLGCFSGEWTQASPPACPMEVMQRFHDTLKRVLDLLSSETS
jgi:hypothetical protein